MWGVLVMASTVGLLLGLACFNRGQELADRRAGLARMLRADGRTRRLALAACRKGSAVQRGRGGHAHSLGVRGLASARVAPSSRARNRRSVRLAPRIAIWLKTFSRRFRADGHPADAMALGSMLIGMAAAVCAELDQAEISRPARVFPGSKLSRIDILRPDRRRCRRAESASDSIVKPGEQRARADHAGRLRFRDKRSSLICGWRTVP